MHHAVEHLRGGNYGPAGGIPLADQAFLDDGHVLQGDFHAQVAARYHDAVGHAQDFVDIFHALVVFDLGDDLGVLARLAPQELPNFQDILGAARERRGDEIDLVCKAEADIRYVLRAEKRNVQLCAGYVDAFMLADHARVFHAADDILPVDGGDGHGNQPVVQQDGIARLHVAVQLRPGNGRLPRRALHGVCAQTEKLPFDKRNFLLFKCSHADLRPLGVQHDRDGQIQLLA